MAAVVPGTVPVEGMLEALAELLAGAYGTAATLQLYQSSFTPNQSSTYADFMAAKADFTGYADVPVVWGTEGLDQAGSATAFGNRGLFQNTTNVVGNLIGGAWLSVQSAVGPPAVNEVVAYYPFPVPIAMSSPLATIAVTPVAQLPDLSGYAVLDV